MTVATTTTSTSQIPVGGLTCQHSPYLKTLTTSVLACSTKPNKQNLYEVQLQDTSTLSLSPSLHSTSL